MRRSMAPDKAGDTSLKMVLDGLYKVAIGIDELRNRYGRDHGRDTPLRGLTERHARLADEAGKRASIWSGLAELFPVAEPACRVAWYSMSVENI